MLSPYNEDIETFVRSCRESNVTYKNTINLVREKFATKIDKNFVWKCTKKTIKSSKTPPKVVVTDIFSECKTVEELIVCMKKRSKTYNEIGKLILEKFPNEDRDPRNLIYKVWHKYKKNNKVTPINRRKLSNTSVLTVGKGASIIKKTSKISTPIITPPIATRDNGVVLLNNPLKPIPEQIASSVLGCPVCGGDLVEDDIRGESACRECGLVSDVRKIDPGPEWRYFDSSDSDKIRTGGPMSWALFDTGLSTDFYPYGTDGRGAQLTAKNKANFLRWRKWHNRNKISDSNKRNLSRAFNELDKMCSQLKIPKSFKEESAVLYRQLRNADLTNGRSINGMITACLYAVCRRRKLPLTQDEILASAPVNSLKELRMCFKRISELGEKIPTATANAYISKYSSELGINTKVTMDAIKLLDVVKKTEISIGRNPVGVAAASLYIISKINGVPKSQRDFSGVCQVTEVTIRQRTKDIVQMFRLYEKYPVQFPPAHFQENV